MDSEELPYVGHCARHFSHMMSFTQWERVRERACGTEEATKTAGKNPVAQELRGLSDCTNLGSGCCNSLLEPP